MSRTGIGLLLSMALHLGVFFIAVGPGRAQQPPEPAAAQATPLQWVQVQMLPRPPGAPAAPPRAATARSSRVPSRQVPGAPAEPPVGAPPVAAASSPAPESGQLTTSAAGPEGTGAGAGEGASVAASGSLGAAGASGAMGPGAVALDHRPLIHARLAAAARRCYPAAAGRFRLRGEVRVQFCLDGNGGLQKVEAASSSGSELLDRAAIDCVLPGALPLAGPAGCLHVPVVFGPD
jgi:periplasmic protein TonB